jgi:hypothetical protein
LPATEDNAELKQIRCGTCIKFLGLPLAIKIMKKTRDNRIRNSKREHKETLSNNITNNNDFSSSIEETELKDQFTCLAINDDLVDDLFDITRQLGIIHVDCLSLMVLENQSFSDLKIESTTTTTTTKTGKGRRKKAKRDLFPPTEASEQFWSNIDDKYVD